MIKSGFLLLLLTALLAGCASDPDLPASPDDRIAALKQRVQELYQQARESGQQVPKDALEWAQQDLRHIGDWEYRIVDLPREDPESRQARLNELGSERWEAFWMEPAGNGMRVYLKRRSKSWLEKIPLSELRRLWPSSGGGCGIVDSRSAEEGFPGAGNSVGGAPGRRGRAAGSRRTTSVFKEIQQWQDSGSVWAACWRVWR